MLRIEEVGDAKALELAWTIRHQVFVEEQGIDPAVEYDGHDNECQHIIAWYGAVAVGTARLSPEAESARIGRLAVLPRFRGLGIGGRILRATMGMAQQLGYAEVYLHAQALAVPFYERHGFRTEGRQFEEAGIPHVTMRAALRSQQ